MVLIAAAVLGYRYWTSDERQIRRLLDGVAEAVSQAEGEGGVTGLAEVAGLSNQLTPDVTVEVTLPTRAAAIRGAQDVVSTVGRFRTVFPVVTLAFHNVIVSVASDTTATVQAIATTERRDREGVREADVWRVQMSVEQRDGKWVIAHAMGEPLEEPAP